MPGIPQAAPEAPVPEPHPQSGYFFIAIYKTRIHGDSFSLLFS